MRSRFQPNNLAKRVQLDGKNMPNRHNCETISRKIQSILISHIQNKRLTRVKRLTPISSRTNVESKIFGHNVKFHSKIINGIKVPELASRQEATIKLIYLVYLNTGARNRMRRLGLRVRASCPERIRMNICILFIFGHCAEIFSIN